MKKTIAIAVVVIILMVALALSVLWAVDVVNSLGANGTQDTIGTTEVVSPETPGVTDESYFNFTAKTMQNDNKETVTYYTVSAKSVENLPEILVIPSEYNGCEVRDIDTEGFAGAKVKKVYIPENIKIIMPNSFQGCTELEEVIVTGGNYALAIRENAFSECTKLKNVSIYNSEGIFIGVDAFKNCMSFTEFNLENSFILMIDEGAFENCTSMKSVYVDEKVTDIAQGAFRKCHNLTITVDAENDRFISTGACLIDKRNNGLIWFRSIDDIPSDGSVTRIDDFTFLEDFGVTKYVMPDFITSIGDAKRSVVGFQNCKSLEEIVFSKNLEEIPTEACKGLEKLKRVDLGGAVRIGSGAFDGCTSLTNIIWSDKIEEVSSFNDCPMLTEIVIPDGVKRISGAFNRCENLTRVTISGGAEWIMGSFEDCPKLKNTVIPEGVTTINHSFNRCNSFTAVSVPSTVNDLQSSFCDCILLKNVELKNAGGIASSFKNCTEITEVVLPSGIIAVSESFTNCTNIRKVTMPISLEHADHSFTDCPFLMDIYYEGTVEEWKKMYMINIEGTTIVHCKDGDVRLGS